ncbi:replication termination factor 2 isoform X2 [Schistocerca piceifrons]|uniref:replication termination factor 2 isoform X2 n=1 Tax=Schistocerca piceifrons TaxID=274613 RepID=UPI001F5E9F8E|nr:replication termination factor 2 isoform X2 [Schistocerca piceifrons]
MGCDGGTIPRRDELVRKKEKPEQKDKNSELSFRWQHCSITQLPLQPPIVACGYGRLYNKDAVIEMLLDKANAPESAKHIKSLKCQKQFSDADVVVLNPVEEDMPLMKERLENRHAKVKAGKKARVEAKKMPETATSSTSNEKNAEEKPVENCKLDAGSLKILNKQNGTKPSEKVSLKRTGNGQIEDPVFKKTKSSYSVAQDPKASEVYKSLFTSHHKANEQVKAHWITYNPFYN